VATTFTLLELKTFARRNGWLGDVTLSEDDAQLGLWINSFEQFLAMERKWDWMQQVYRFNLSPPYTTGTVTVATGGTTVTAGGAALFPQTALGQEFWTDDDGFHLYYIASIDSCGASLAIDPAYLGAGGAGLTYAVRYVRYAVPADWGQEGKAYLDTGLEMNIRTPDRGEWEQRRMWQPGTMSIPVSLARFGDYFYCEGAPLDARQVRVVYWRKPAWMDSDSAVSTFLRPEVLGLLTESLAVRLKAYDGETGLMMLRDKWFQDKIDLVFNARTPRKPLHLADGSQGDRFSPFGGLAQVLRITEP